ncbi:MAG TPA: hypothetical protein VNE39_16020 [Planctomycetota bacterium]|nr:hypothetical protein [Planctomycetota bacterium]
MRSMGAASGLVVALAAAALAAELPEMTPKVTDVTVFKDGHALVMARGAAELKDGWCRTREVPAPVLGTFWAFVGDAEARVDFVKAGFVEATESVPCLSLDQIIQANKGKKVTIVEQPKDAPAQTHTGILRGILEREGEREAPVTRSVPRRYDRWGRYTGTENVTETREEEFRSLASFVMLETEQGTVLLQRDSIRSLAIAGKEVTTTRTETKQVREIAVRVLAKGKPASGKHDVGFVYLQKGVRWIPDYRVELLDEKKAKVSLYGTIINELADLDNVTLRLVVGVPSFLMRENLSPLALRDVALQLSHYFAPPSGAGGRGVAGQDLSNAMMSQMAAPMQRDEGPAARGGPDIPAEGQQEDLFLYQKQGISLKKGERAEVHLLDVTVPYEHTYVWELPFLPPRELWRHINQDQQRQLTRALTGAKAMHKLRLSNTGQTPWTTGPATIFKDGTVLGQQLMTFTSAGNKVELPVTIATDLNTKKEETEVARKHNDLTVGTTNYTRVSLRSKLTVTSFKDREVRLVVRRKLIGTVDKASEGAKVTSFNPQEEGPDEAYSWWYWWWPGWMAVNPFSEVSWEATLKKGEAATLEYDWHYHCVP